MALSDDEQRILRQIEEQLQTDESFAQAVSSSGLYAYAARKVRWAAVGAIVGLVAMVVSLAVHFVLAFALFLFVLMCALTIEREVRLMGRVGAKDIVDSLRPASRLGGRFRRD